jgi:hypothetical protein
VERFVVVGESIADENPEIQPEMYNACEEARIAGFCDLSIIIKYFKARQLPTYITSLTKNPTTHK